jgi:surface carbohydrate biosynthesis protein
MHFKFIHFSIPKDSQILIYDTAGYEFYKDYLDKYKVEKLSLRGESINLYILFYAILKRIFSNDKLRDIYIDLFIKCVNPKIIVTWVDNNINFYSLSKKYKDIKTLFIQNGARVEYGDIFEKLIINNEHSVDFMCVFNKNIGNHYKKFISGETLVTGSLINNKMKKNNKLLNNNIIVFISQFNPDLNLKSTLSSLKSSSMSFDIFWNTERRVIKYLAKWCYRNNKKIIIAGRTSNTKEINFYNCILKNYDNWDFIPKEHQFNSYNLLKKADFSVALDTTLGFEALARDFKVAFISRKPDIGFESATFGWPKKLKNEGFFWTNSNKYISIKRVLDNVSSASLISWKKEISPYSKNLMHYDYGNKKFQKLIARLLG